MCKLEAIWEGRSPLPVLTLSVDFWTVEIKSREKSRGKHYDGKPIVLLGGSRVNQAF